MDPGVSELLLQRPGVCPYCSCKCIKYGKTGTGTARYRCKGCSKTHSGKYIYAACRPETLLQIKMHVKEGCGIRSISRLLRISVNTVLKRILLIAKNIRKPLIVFGKDYELDELRTYVKRKTSLLWIVYAIRR